ncbi:MULTISPECIES: DeoR/GlpR family DNA-binding transcription regulator [Crateriforma]|uniref:Glucitol operon repressor n=1 Tax=Crateriforma conspicua TaxID=2527996 RepID=A0A5C6FPN3_9PLAN|nr:MULTISPECIES: DeoR/GlpR family DNA-binding transcription regulator [Crateriforma]QDV61368.1 Glucitol operon repressor [Crateriforma conspicua]TWT72379.1 Glucitol operon repressor [Crateriforma conspicua]TWU63244.1 Glucitol operon repressor [Crateriforma conspicua]
MATLSQNRREKLRQLVQTQGFVSLGDLASTLEVSESTVRRDLESLEQAGQARRTHGGVFWTGEGDKMPVFANRRDDRWAAKRAIGKLASEMIDDDETVLLDGGSTTYEIARHLVGRPLQVVTNSLPVAYLLSASDSIDLIMIGGCVRGRTAVAIGPLADLMLAQINVSKAFLSVAGVTERGYFNSDMMLVESEKQMLKAADEAIVVADSSKFGRVSLSRMCGLQDVARVVTDDGLNSQWKGWLKAAGVELALASGVSRSGQDE